MVYINTNICMRKVYQQISSLAFSCEYSLTYILNATTIFEVKTSLGASGIFWMGIKLDVAIVDVKSDGR